MPRILIIDDEAQIRLMLRMTFEDEGYEVVEASDGAEGIELFTCNPTDCVITDIIMPEKEGIETILELKKLDPELKIIAISGGGKSSPDDYLAAAERLGANRTFFKPIDRAELVTAVRELLQCEQTS